MQNLKSLSVTAALFGWSMLMARRLLDANVNLIQVNLGNFNTWDLHRSDLPIATRHAVSSG